MKEKNPEYTGNNRRGSQVATKCRKCGGKLYHPDEMKKEIHSHCDKDNTNIYLM